MYWSLYCELFLIVNLKNSCHKNTRPWKDVLCLNRVMLMFLSINRPWKRVKSIYHSHERSITLKYSAVFSAVFFFLVLFFSIFACNDWLLRISGVTINQILIQWRLWFDSWFFDFHVSVLFQFFAHLSQCVLSESLLWY